MTQIGTGPPVTDTTTVTRLRRSRQDRVVAGVCGGLGAYLGVDPLWFRLAFVVLAVGGGSGVLLYILAWLVIPEQRAEESLSARQGTNSAEGAVIAGVILVAAGLMFLFNTVFPWFDRIMWPVVVIVAGLGLLYAGRRRDR